MHFDLKPSDVRLCRDGLVRVGGFGLAAVCRSDGRASGWSGGSRLYAAPERVRGGALDARSDVYSAGALLYVMVSGRLPRGGGATPGSGLSYLSERVAKLADVAPDLHVPDGLEWVLQRALAPNANERFQSMDDMKTALLALEEGLVPEVESLEPMSRRDTDEAPIRRSGRAKRAMLVASFAMASLGLMAAMAAIVLTVVGPPLPASDMTVVHITGDIAVEDIVIRDVDGLQVAGSEMPPGQYTLHVNFGAGLRPHADMLLRGGPVQVDCWRASAHCNVQAVP
jgi:serine/threonine-protein kinase